MNFPQWLKQNYGKSFEELYCKVSDLTLIEYSEYYESYCRDNNINPVWF